MMACRASITRCALNIGMPGTHAASDSERDDRQLATYFESLPRDAAQRGSFTTEEVAEIVRQDRDAANR